MTSLKNEMVPDVSDFEVNGWLVLLKVLKEAMYDRITCFPDPGMGIILKLGEEAFDKKVFSTFKPLEGDLVLFDGFKQAQSLKFHNTRCVLLPDTSIVAVMGDSKWKDKILEDYKDVAEGKVST